MAQAPNANARRAGGLTAIVGSVAAAALLILTPAKEGTKLTTYRDPVGVLTYCTGATENAQWGKSYTPEQCKAQLDYDLARHAEGISRCVNMEKLTDGQKIAYVDFAFNVGVTAFCGSTVARKANAGDLRGSCDALLMWDKAGGRVLPGLVLRRQQERAFCLGGEP